MDYIRNMRISRLVKRTPSIHQVTYDTVVGALNEYMHTDKKTSHYSLD